MKILDGATLASFIKERQRRQIANLVSSGITPHLLIIRDSNNPVIAKYVNLKIKYGEDIGAKVTDLCVPTAELSSAIEKANLDPTIHGIILQLPILEKTQTDHITSLITPTKDVDGLSGHGNYDSATATAINWLLAGYDIPLASSKIAIIGRGKLVGAPLYQIFTASGYDVTMFHRGDDLTKLKNFDIIISATGTPGVVSDDMIKSGTTLVDAGTASENGVIKGDLSPGIYHRTDLKAITPRIGGVGPLTISCLFDHLIQATTLR
ncbi:bifunctional 5,10-methylenetetrahydrofolate dehydrogenase/5,10-methenyltetrahydrofolate cyclohydrolase [Candidatus Saccharibacteria bacterium]|nr:bifunctional 5,10-methylenetetrahydrofolate dehydrogenase/5,10-methenyltetrahydrofolate cyclohydrolase [Candidatus Saccharibacteria bacterium]